MKADYLLAVLEKLKDNDGGLQFTRGSTKVDGVFRIILSGAWNQEETATFFNLAEVEVEGSIEQITEIQNKLNAKLNEVYPKTLKEGVS